MTLYIKNIAFFSLCYLGCILVLPAQWSASSIAFPGAERDGATAFAINGKGYVANGTFSSDCRQYNPATETWTDKAPMINGKTISFTTTFVYNNKGYMVAGDTAFGESAKAAYMYDPVANTWSPKADFPGGKRVGMVAWVVNNRVFAGGGADYINGSGVGTCHNDLYEYFPVADTWSYAGTLPAKLAFASVFVIRDTCYLALGMSDNSTYLKKSWQFKSTDMSWTAKTDFPGTGRSSGIGFALNGMGYAGMGQVGFTTNYQDLYSYDPINNQWHKESDYPDDKSGWSAAFVIGDSAYVGTGLNLQSFEFGKAFYVFSKQPTSGIITPEKLSDIKLYPNPSGGRVAVPESFGNVVMVTDVTGKDCTYLCDVPEPSVLDIQNLSSGIYLVRSDKNLTVKIIRQ